MARLLANYETHVCLSLMQAMDSKFGSNRIANFGPEDLHSLLKDFVEQKKSQGDERSQVKAIAKKSHEPAPSLHSDHHLSHVFHTKKNDGPSGLAKLARNSIGG